MQVVEARRCGSPAEGRGRRGREPAGADAAARCRAAWLGEPRGPWRGGPPLPVPPRPWAFRQAPNTRRCQESTGITVQAAATYAAASTCWQLLPLTRPQPTPQPASTLLEAPGRSCAGALSAQHGKPRGALLQGRPPRDPATCPLNTTQLVLVALTRLAANRPGQDAARYPFPSRTQGDRRPALGGLLRSQKECGWETPEPAQASPRPLLGWNRKAKRGKTGGRLSPAPHP